MKIAIVGSRDYAWLDHVREFVRTLPHTATVISGDARGVDTAAQNEARRLGLLVDVYPADWTKSKRRAGAIRNLAMVNAADYVVAFWDGQSKGTKMTMTMASKQGKLRPPLLDLLVPGRLPCSACRDQGWVVRHRPDRRMYYTPCVACAFAGRYPDLRGPKPENGTE